MQHDRVAVRRRAQEGFGGDQSAGPLLVLHDHRRAELLPELLGDQAREGVARSPGREADHDPQDLLGERHGQARNVRQHACGGLQEVSSAGSHLRIASLTSGITFSAVRIIELRPSSGFCQSIPA